MERINRRAFFTGLTAIALGVGEGAASPRHPEVTQSEATPIPENINTRDGVEIMTGSAISNANSETAPDFSISN